MHGSARSTSRLPRELAAAWVILAVVAGTGVIPLSLIDQMVVLGVAATLPLALGGPGWWWIGAAASVLASFVVPVGWAGLFVAPFLVAAMATVIQVVAAAGQRRSWEHRDVVKAVASVYALVAAGALVQSRSGAELFGLREPIIELTAVHYMFAGSGALVLAGAVRAGAGGRWGWAATGAVVCTASAPPVVACGFLTGAALPQVGGAVLMTLGVWLTAGLQLRAVVVHRRPTLPAVLLGISGFAVWAPMVLAVAWAAGQHWDVPVLSIPDMARTHGLANALAFVICGLLGRRLQAPVAADGPVAVPG